MGKNVCERGGAVVAGRYGIGGEVVLAWEGRERS